MNLRKPERLFGAPYVYAVGVGYNFNLVFIRLLHAIAVNEELVDVLIGAIVEVCVIVESGERLGVLRF
jgi:hypothetical protein